MAEETASSVNEKIRLAIASYKQNFDRVNKEERYKWEAAGWYKSHWNIDAPDFASMLAAAFKKTGNLLTSRNYWPYRMAKEFAQASPETVRSLFRTLYDENIPLAKRYGAFCTGFDGYVKPLGKRHYQDLHTVSVYLSFEYPEKYFIYKYGIYKNFRDHIGYADDVPEHKSKIWEFESHMRMCNIILDEIHKDSVLIELSGSRIDGSCAKDEAMHMLAFDIAYYGAVHMNDGDFAGTRNEETESNAYWPSLDEYNPGITVEMWTDVLNDRSVTTFENLERKLRAIPDAENASLILLADKDTPLHFVTSAIDIVKAHIPYILPTFPGGLVDVHAEIQAMIVGELCVVRPAVHRIVPLCHAPLRLELKRLVRDGDTVSAVVVPCHVEVYAVRQAVGGDNGNLVPVVVPVRIPPGEDVSEIPLRPGKRIIQVHPGRSGPVAEVEFGPVCPPLPRYEG